MPAPLTRGEVVRIATLAHLELSDAEAELLGRQLTDILSFAGQIAEVDTRNVPPAAPARGDEPAPRPDETRPSLAREAALANAPEPDASRRFFKVPRVIS